MSSTSLAGGVNCTTLSDNSPSHKITLVGGSNSRNLAVNGARKSSGRSGNNRRQLDVSQCEIRERLIHLLALKPFKKLELYSRLTKEGLSEKERQLVDTILNDISTLSRFNNYSLKRSMWQYVDENWPFFTKREVLLLERHNPTNLTPILGILPKFPTLARNPKAHLEVSDSSELNEVNGIGRHLKRGSQEPALYDEASTMRVQSRKRRVGHYEKDTPNYNRTSNGVSNKKPSSSPTKENRTSRGSTPTSSGYCSSTSINQRESSPVAMSRSKTPTPYASYFVPEIKTTSNCSTKTKQAQSSTSFSSNTSRSSSKNSKSLKPSQKQQSTKTSYNGKTARTLPQETAPHSTNSQEQQQQQYSAPTQQKVVEASSLTNHHSSHVADGLYFDYRNYTTITSMDQRRQYKTEFEQKYDEYSKLWAQMGRVGQRYNELVERLNYVQYGSHDYYIIKDQIESEFDRIHQEETLNRDIHRFEYLYAKLSHIRQLVVDCDKKLASGIAIAIQSPAQNSQHQPQQEQQSLIYQQEHDPKAIQVGEHRSYTPLNLNHHHQQHSIATAFTIQEELPQIKTNHAKRNNNDSNSNSDSDSSSSSSSSSDDDCDSDSDSASSSSCSSSSDKKLAGGIAKAIQTPPQNSQQQPQQQQKSLYHTNANDSTAHLSPMRHSSGEYNHSDPLIMNSITNGMIATSVSSSNTIMNSKEQQQPYHQQHLEELQNQQERVAKSIQVDEHRSYTPSNLIHLQQQHNIATTCATQEKLPEIKTNHPKSNNSDSDSKSDSDSSSSSSSSSDDDCNSDSGSDSSSSSSYSSSSGDASDNHN